MKKILSTFFYIVIIFILLINIFSTRNVSFLGYRVFRVVSGSMEPCLKNNDLILTKSSSNYKKNDIITFKDGNIYVTHRLIKTTNGKYITKGDANNIADNPINKKNIVGKLIYKFKLISFLCYLLYSPIFWLLIIIIAFLIPFYKKKEAIE